jgi:glutathione-regulated potassium-efflux system ancillary protein KefC
MHNQRFFIQAFVYLLAAVISVPIAKRLGLGSVLGYLLAGVIIGPFVLGFIGTGENDIMHFAEFGVVMMLFLIGLELRPSLLWKMRSSIFGLGSLQVVLTALTLGSLALMAGQAWSRSVAIGLILALSSTAIVLQTLSEKGLLKSRGGQSAFSILLFQDIAVIPILALLPLLAVNHGQGSTSHESGPGFIADLTGWQHVLMIILVMVGIILIGRFASGYIFRLIAATRLREIFTAAALLIVIAIALAMNAVGLSPALGTFLAGVVLADNEYRHELEADIEPFKGLLLGLFFIAVGASINFRLMAEQPFLVIALLSIFISVKAIILNVLARVFKLDQGSGWLLTFSLAQGGEFAFVLISFSLQNSILDQQTAGLVTIIVALSMVLTPLMLIVNEKLVQPYYSKRLNQPPDDTIDEQDSSVIIAGFGRFGVIVGRLLLASGFQKATILDNDPAHIDSLRKYGFKVYYGDASRPDLLEAAGIARSTVLVLALNDYEKTNRIAEYVKKKYPHVKISARARDISHSYELGKLHVDHIKPEVAHSAIELGISALQDLGFNSFRAHRAARIFKYHNQEVKRGLFKLWEKDRNQYISEVKRHALELEEILKRESDQSIHESDAAWDNTSVREEVIQIYAEMDQNKFE